MRTLQLIALGLFAVCAVLTIFFQLCVGMDAGRDKSPAPHRNRAGVCACLAAIFLVAAMVLGALQR